MNGKADAKIKDFAKRVKKKYNIEKAIFLGSRARDDNFKNSDYDIVLVSKDFEGTHFTKRIAAMYDFWKHYPLDIEPFCYTPLKNSTKKQKSTAQ